MNGTGLVTGVATGTAKVQAALGILSAASTVSVTQSAGQFIQWSSGDGSSITSETVYQYSPAKTGNLILVLVHWDNQAAEVTIKDQVGNQYIPIFNPINVGTTERFNVWYAKNIQGGVPLAVTLSFSQKTETISVADVIEYAGLDRTAPLDVFTWSTGDGTSQNTGNMPATTAASETIIGLFGYSGYRAPYFAGPGFTLRDYDASTMLEDKPAVTTGVYSATATSSSSSNWAAFALGMRNQ